MIHFNEYYNKLYDENIYIFAFLYKFNKYLPSKFLIIIT